MAYFKRGEIRKKEEKKDIEKREMKEKWNKTKNFFSTEKQKFFLIKFDYHRLKFRHEITS